MTNNVCPRCNTELRTELRHVQPVAGPLIPPGAPGKNIRRVVCECGCKSVETFVVLDLDRMQPRCTVSLLFSDHFSLSDFLHVNP